MKIAIVCYPTYGGSGVVATELGYQLALRAHKVHFVSSAMPFRLVHRFSPNVFFHEVEQSSYPLFQQPLYTLALSVKLEKLIYQEKLDLLHIHYAIPHAISALLAKQMAQPQHVPLVTTLHGTDITLVGSNPAYKSIVKYAINQSEAVTAVSHWLCAETVREFGIERPIEVIHNFFDAKRFDRPENHVDREHYARAGEKIILHASNFRPVKRTPDVVRIFAQIAKKLPAKLLLIGDGPERAATLDLARQLNLMDRIWYLGKQDIVEPFFTIADLLLFPSEQESFGLAALEAMAGGAPVVASDAGGLPEVIEDGVDGFLAPPGDVDAMAAKSLSVLLDDVKWRAIRDRAKEKAETVFSPSRIVDQYENLYRTLLDAPDSGSKAK